jgi:hypothetical protein
MAKTIRIDNITGEVVNVALPATPPNGFSDINVDDNSPVSIGWKYVNGQFEISYNPLDRPTQQQ